MCRSFGMMVILSIVMWILLCPSVTLHGIASMAKGPMPFYWCWGGLMFMV